MATKLMLMFWQLWVKNSAEGTQSKQIKTMIQQCHLQIDPHLKQLQMNLLLPVQLPSLLHCLVPAKKPAYCLAVSLVFLRIL